MTHVTTVTKHAVIIRMSCRQIGPVQFVRRISIGLIQNTPWSPTVDGLWPALELKLVVLDVATILEFLQCEHPVNPLPG
jgi:hypothetical protein